MKQPRISIYTKHEAPLALTGSDALAAITQLEAHDTITAKPSSNKYIFPYHSVAYAIISSQEDDSAAPS